jgi:hypothetical protein
LIEGGGIEILGSQSAVCRAVEGGAMDEFTYAKSGEPQVGPTLYDRRDWANIMQNCDS